MRDVHRLCLNKTKIACMLKVNDIFGKDARCLQFLFWDWCILCINKLMPTYWHIGAHFWIIVSVIRVTFLHKFNKQKYIILRECNYVSSLVLMSLLVLQLSLPAVTDRLLKTNPSTSTNLWCVVWDLCLTVSLCSQTTSEPVVAGSFYSFDGNILITYGKEHIHFWRIFWDKDGKIMRDKLSGNFQVIDVCL